MTTTTCKTDWQLVNPNITPLTGWEVLSEEYDGKHSYLVEYYKACRRGEIQIGRELKTELETVIQDIGDPDVRFDLSPAHKRIDFIEKNIVRPAGLAAAKQTSEGVG